MAGGDRIIGGEAADGRAGMELWLLARALWWVPPSLFLLSASPEHPFLEGKCAVSLTFLSSNPCSFLRIPSFSGPSHTETQAPRAIHAYRTPPPPRPAPQGSALHSAFLPRVSEKPRSLSSLSCAHLPGTAPWSWWLSLALLGPMPAATRLACPLRVHQLEQASVPLCLQGQVPSD